MAAPAATPTFGWNIDTNSSASLQEAYDKFKALSPEDMTKFLMTILVGPQTIQPKVDAAGKKEDKKGVKKGELRNAVAEIVTRHHGAAVAIGVKTMLEEQKLKYKSAKEAKKLEEKAAKKAAKDGAVKA